MGRDRYGLRAGAAAVVFLALAGLSFGRGADSSHPVGRVNVEEQARIVVRDDDLWTGDAIVPGERLMLTTVGVEHLQGRERSFYPLLSIVIDRTFPEAPRGQWLAAWNLGHQPPGLFSRVKAGIPVWIDRKRSPEDEVRKLEMQLETFTELTSQGKVRTPAPFLKLTEPHRKSTLNLALAGAKQGIRFVRYVPGLSNFSFGFQLLFRNFLLRRTDLEEREFVQAYLGLSWYGERAVASMRQGMLAADGIQDMKARLLANRHILGRWVDPLEEEDFVHGFENELRDHFWGTSCFLASAANEYHLGYEELRRIGAGGVPLALGGILYYDPELAPEPDQVRWSILNPFDLTYNPFKNPKVQEAAARGSRVPLAIYAYQSNMALKPIIVVDFIDSKNPRLREAVSYWRKLGNEALSSIRNIGLPYEIVRRTLGFVANRKGLTWFSDKKLALGIEEFRLSLASYLYFEAEAAEDLLDRVDGVIVNPLVQPARLHRLTAQLHYRSLLAHQGSGVVRIARQIREKRIRKVSGKEDGLLTAADFEAYRRQLKIDHNLRPLEVCLNDVFVPSVAPEKVRESIRNLGATVRDTDHEAVETLMRFRSMVQARPGALGDAETAGEMVSRTDLALEQIFVASGLTRERLDVALVQVAEREVVRRAKARQEWQNQQAEKFTQEMKEHIKFLEGFVDSGADLTLYSPWYLSEALDFLRFAPQVIEMNPKAAKKYRAQELRVNKLLAEVERQLALPAEFEEVEWLGQQRAYCLQSVRLTQSELRAALKRPATSRTDAVAAGIEDGGGR